VPNDLTKDDIRKLIGDEGSAKRKLLEELFEEAETTGLNELQDTLDSEFNRWHSQIRDALDREFEAIRAAEHGEYGKMKSLLDFSDKHKKDGDQDR
jgi:hypothetical protein